MWKNISSEKTKSFIERHFGPTGKEVQEAAPKPAITVSRQEGAGGLAVASNLATYLEANTGSHEEWTVFSQHLVAKVLEEYHHDERVAALMKEGHKGFSFAGAFQEFFGLHPSTWTLVEQTNATILRLAKIATVILVGRGANIVTRGLETAFHVYLVGSLEKRLEQAEKVLGLDRKSAMSHIKKKDENRRRYVKDNFDRDIDDPLLYHMVINTDFISFDDAARLIGDEVINRFRLGNPVEVKAS